MGLRTEIKEYTEQKYPFVSNTKNPPDNSSDNGLLFTATYYILLGDEYTISDRATFFSLVDKCSITNGLYNRYPGNNSYQTHDDYIGVAALSSLCAKHIRSYGLEHLGIWNNVNPGKWRAENFFWRLPGFSSLS